MAESLSAASAAAISEEMISFLQHSRTFRGKIFQCKALVKDMSLAGGA